jgi:hypothetical protein
MKLRACILLITISTVPVLRVVRADEIVYRYEGDILPHEAGMLTNPCSQYCVELIKDGRFVIRWETGGELVGYGHRIAQPPELPPPPSFLAGVAIPFESTVEPPKRFLRRRDAGSIYERG